MVSGFGPVTSTNPVSGPESNRFTFVARSLNPSYMPSNATMKWARSRRKFCPVNLASVRSTRPVGKANSLRPMRLALSSGPSTMRMASLSSTSRIRSGARKKSRAFAVGGVSRTTTSKRPEVWSSYTFSIAMYSRLPAIAVESFW